ncbi:magnesium transporter [Paenalkalicoccus suaedae]|uniref:Magnesium transporter MgtE n=1 Tax=Paenalkalicoccus suaedae TaxID=2592382 RepID=A0A859FJB7_9BACI|nr:magnesium transporter [Paenalkalicoccus suaedae]QKS72826.1 magnesium transporter [Paenalkalicoccus suaedae]
MKQIHAFIEERRLDEAREALLELHPREQGELYLSLNEGERLFLYEILSPSELGDIFEHLSDNEREDFLDELDETYSAMMLNEMNADDAADILQLVDEAKAERIFAKMQQDGATELRQLMNYEEETAGSIMTTEFVVLKSTERVSDVMTHLRDEAPNAETIYYLYVVDEVGKLAGVISLRDLIVADPSEFIEDKLNKKVVSVDVSLDQEEVARIIKKYDFLAVPVVTNDNHLVGIITVDDILDVVDEETEEDFGEISGARGSMNTKLSSFEAARARAPWIIMLMLFGLITANVIGFFEETLETIVLLAAFIPMIMGSAGNTGTQALAVVVRGLAVGTIDRSRFFYIIKKEFGTGALLGITCALTMLIIIPIFYDSFIIAAIVGTSLFLTLCMATVIGATIPIIINKFNIDPAVASGPFITTINDVIGLLIYFSIATSMLQYL